jgi:hypothetical protein
MQDSPDIPRLDCEWHFFDYFSLVPEASPTMAVDGVCIAMIQQAQASNQTPRI